MSALNEGAIYGTAKLISGFNDYLNSGLSLPRIGANAPSLTTYRDGLFQLAFDGGVSLNETWANIHILHDYKDGTKIYPHIHWSHIVGAPSGDVKWNIEYSVSKGHSGGTFGASTTVSVTQTAGAQYTHQIAEVSEGDAIDATNLEPDSVVQFRVYRDPTDGADTFANDAYLIYFDCHVESDRILTNEKVSPFTKTIR